MNGRSTIQLTAALAASVLLHVTVLLPWLIGVMTSQAGHEPRRVSLLDPASLDNQITLGIEEGATSTIDWVGYEEYEEHLAELSEVNQADLTRDPLSGSRPGQPLPPEETAAIAPSEEALPLIEPIDPVEAQPADRAQAPHAIEIPDFEPITIAPEAMLEPSSKWLPASFFGPIREREGALRDTPETAVDIPAPVPLPLELLRDVLARLAQPDPQGDPVPPGERAKPSDQPGDPSEKESDPSSTIEVAPENWRHGKPLAARGLELFPRKPRFTILTRITASPSNPLCMMRFDSRGVVVRARIIESSGHSRVDQNLLDSLYDWRAKGEQLEALEDDETIEIEMRFLFN